MWKYKTGEYVNMGDTVKISESWCRKNKYPDRLATVVGLNGFVCVHTMSGDRVDFYPRSLTLVCRKRLG